MRLADVIGWLGPASLALGVAGAVSPIVAGAAVAVGVGATVTLGVAHGALDHELPQRLRQASQSATVRIACGYAIAVVAGFAAFLAAPLLLLATFLVVAVLHFGTADLAFAQRYTGLRSGKFARLSTLMLGAFPIVIPAVSHPQAVLASLPHVADAAMFASSGWLVFRIVFLGMVTLAVLGATIARARRANVPGWYRCELAVALAAFIVAPPIVAFLLYFGCWHAARHLVRLSEAYGVDADALLTVASARPLAAFAGRAVPMTIGALLLGGAFAVLLARTVPLSLIALALAFAVTVPHTFAVRFFNRSVTSLSMEL